MFGDKEAYLNKFKTCARTRPLEQQRLGTEHHIKEHTKPLFAKHNLMTIHNLYFYHCINDVAKILKFRTPISMFTPFKLSSRIGKETLIILPPPSDSFLYRAGKIWNTTCSKLKITTFTFKINHIKSTIKRIIAKVQMQGDSKTWCYTVNTINQNFVTTLAEFNSNSKL